jgi:aminoglycoside phosphotransferase (APT) family kinase protein
MSGFEDQPRSVRPGEELDAARLEPFLLRHFPESGAGIEITQFPGGHSNLTYLVRLGEREFVLRRPPFGSKVKSAHDMGREYRVLSKLHGMYAPAPAVLLYCDDQDVLGAPFYLMERVRGVIIRRDPPEGFPFSADTARRLSETFIDNLARLHSLDYQAIGLGDLGKPQGYMERQVRGWMERYGGSKTDEHSEVERLAAWFRERTPAAGEATLIHNDYKYDNIVLDPRDSQKIIGVLDWEMSTLGDPLSDLGTSLAYWVDPQDSPGLQRIRWCPSTYPGSPTRAELAERYARASGRDVSGLVFYLAFARFKLAVIVQQIYYRYRQGLTQDARFAAMGEVVKTMLAAALDAAETNSL